MISSKTETGLKAVDFFCGSGGMSYGLQKAGIEIISGIDINPDCRETYEKNINSVFLQKDVKLTNPEDLTNELGIQKNDDSLIFIGCSPCQFWSRINTIRTKSECTKDLLLDFWKYVDYFKPGYILVENVPGIKNNPENEIISEFTRYLEKNNYKFDHNILDANSFGVPQHRKRYVLIASRINDEIALPIGKPGVELTLRAFIGEHNGFPKIRAGQIDKTNFIHTAADLSDKNKKRIGLTRKDGGDRSAWKDIPELQIPAYINKDNQFKDVYGRMFWDKVAPTITTRFNSFSSGRFGHPEENRAISLREGATLQTFPKDYVFYGPNQSAITRLIGNAVPPEFAKHLGISLMEYYKKSLI